MSCRDVQAKLPEYELQSLAAGDAGAVQQHLAQCKDCQSRHREILEELSWVRTMDEADGTDVPPADLSWMPTSPRQVAWRRWIWLRRAAAALLIVWGLVAVFQVNIEIENGRLTVAWSEPVEDAPDSTPTPRVPVESIEESIQHAVEETLRPALVDLAEFMKTLEEQQSYSMQELSQWLAMFSEQMQSIRHEDARRYAMALNQTHDRVNRTQQALLEIAESMPR